MYYNRNEKVKWSRYRPGVAQRVGRGIALLLHDRRTRRGWVVNKTPRLHFTPRERTGTHFTVGWVGPSPGLDGQETSSPPGFFFCYQHTFIQVPCVRSSTYVTTTVSIILAVRMFIVQGALSLPTPLCLSVHHSHVHYTRTTRIHSLPPHFTLQNSARLLRF